MARQRKHLSPKLAALLAILAPLPSWSGTPDILLPEPFAVELPAGTTTLSADDATMTTVLAGVQAGGDRVTASLPRDRVGPGAFRVILSAWAADVRDRPLARREAVLLVLPHGMTPIGGTGVGSPRIARDADGFVHMIWTDGWRAGAREGAMYRRAHQRPDGTVAFDTAILDLAPHRGDWAVRPVLAAAGDTVHFAWQSNGTIWYRSLTRVGQDWRWSDETDTKLPSPGRDEGPAIAAGADAVHVLTTDGHYLASRDQGRTWTAEVVPFGTYARIGGISLSLDREGRPLAAASVWIEDAGNAGGHCALRLARRVATGAWQALPGPLDGQAEWAARGPSDAGLACDSVRVMEDQNGAMHAVWRGTPADRAEFGAQAYYAWRSPSGDWHPPAAPPRPDPLHGFSTSAPGGLILDRDSAMPVITRELHSGWRYRGADAEMELFHDGARAAPAREVTRFVSDAMTASEPNGALSVAASDAVPGPFHSPDVPARADLLMVLSPTNVAAPGVVVWSRSDVSDWLRSVGQ